MNAGFVNPQIKKTEQESYAGKRISNEDEVFLLVMNLSGKIKTWDEKDQTFKWVQFGQPVMNQEGINFVIGNLRLITGKMVVSANVESEQLAKWQLKILNDIAKGLTIESKKFEIRKDKLTFFYGSIRYWVLASSTRGKDGFEAELTAPNIVENIIQKDRQQAQAL